MSCSIFDTKVRRVLDAMHDESDAVDPPLLARARGKVGAERAELMQQAYIPVSRDAGRFLYALVRSTTGTVVEFGTSFGISTIYMAAAVRDRGAGSVITTEIYPRKAERARKYIEAADLGDLVDIRVGDALETLRNVEADVSVVFLDGMKNLYSALVQLLEPKLRSGALIVADDTELFPDELAPYLNYVRDPEGGFLSVAIPIGDGMELSTRVG